MKVTVSNEPAHLEIEWAKHMENITSALILSGYTVTTKAVMKRWPEQHTVDHFEIDAVKESEIEMEEKK